MAMRHSRTLYLCCSAPVHPMSLHFSPHLTDPSTPICNQLPSHERPRPPSPCTSLIPRVPLKPAAPFPLDFKDVWTLNYTNIPILYYILFTKNTGNIFGDFWEQTLSLTLQHLLSLCGKNRIKGLKEKPKTVFRHYSCICPCRLASV